MYPEISRQRFHCLQVYYCSNLKCFLLGFTDNCCRVKQTEIPGEEGSDYINAYALKGLLQCKIAIPFIANALEVLENFLHATPYPADLSYSTI